MTAFLWFPYRALLIAGAGVAALGAASLAAVIRRGRAWPEQDVMIRKLWVAVKQILPGHPLTDPNTGELLGVEQERGWLTLTITDPPGPGAETVVTRYLLGK